jgi:hypothetical protein
LIRELGLPIVDVEAWLDSIDPSVIDRWLAYDRLEPISAPWQHTAQVCAALWEAIAIIAAGQGVELPPRSGEYWIPDRTGSRQPPAPAATNTTDLAAAEAALAKRFG